MNFERFHEIGQVIWRELSKYKTAYIFVVLIAVIGAIFASGLMSHFYPNLLFGHYVLIIPSLLTWLPLAWKLRTSSLRLVFRVGLIAPFIGGVWTAILKIGPASEFSAEPNVLSQIGAIFGRVLLGIGGTLTFCPITIPLGILMALSINWMWRRKTIS